MTKEKPNCYNCKFRGELYGDCHSKCFNLSAKVKGNEYGKEMGWFLWPLNFDPTWLEECDGFESKINK